MKKELPKNRRNELNIDQFFCDSSIFCYFRARVGWAGVVHAGGREQPDPPLQGGGAVQPTSTHTHLVLQVKKQTNKKINKQKN